MVKLKHDTHRMDYRNGGMRNVVIHLKLISLQYSWPKKHYKNFFHKWKIIQQYWIRNSFDNQFMFHSNVSFKNTLLKQFLLLFQLILISWEGPIVLGA